MAEKYGEHPGRQFIQLALLVPGASAGGRAVQQNAIRQGEVGGLSIAGGRTNNTVFLLDGAAKNHQRKLSQDYLSTPRQQKFQENQLWSSVHGFWKD